MTRQLMSATIAAAFLALTGSLIPMQDAQGNPVSTTTMADYTAVPHFLDPNTVPPNIVLVADFSDSTLKHGYGEYPRSKQDLISSNVNGVDGDGNGVHGLCNTNTDTSTNPQPAGCPAVNEPPDVFDPNTTYYGLFGSDRCYTPESGGNRFNFMAVKAGGVSDTCPDLTTQWDGNFLNWLAMRKIDIAKKVLVGGKSLATAKSDGTVHTVNGEDLTGAGGSNNKCGSQNADCWRYVKAANEAGVRYPSGTLADASGFTYFGMGEGIIYWAAAPDIDSIFTSSSPQVVIEIDVSNDTDEWRFENTRGLLQTLEDAGIRLAVFRMAGGNSDGAVEMNGIAEKLNSSQTASIRNQAATTQNALVESTYEILCFYRHSQGGCYKNSNFQSAVGTDRDPYYYADLGQLVGCAQCNILMVNSGIALDDLQSPSLQPFGDPWASDAVGQAGVYLDDITWRGNTQDVREQPDPDGIAGTQTVTWYAVSVLSGKVGNAVLAQGAKYGGFVDQNGDNLPDAGSQACTYPAGSQLGSGSSTSSPEWDEDADCVPDTFFEANQAGELESQIMKAVNRILSRAASGSAASVVASSSTGEGALYRSFFFPEVTEGARKIGYVGYVEGLFIDAFGNVREDTDGDGKLVYDKDKIVRTFLDPTDSLVKAGLHPDADGNGLADSDTPASVVDLRNVTSLWEAGERLANRTSCARTILTWIDEDGDGLVDAGEQIPFDATCGATDYSGRLAPFLNTDGTAPYTAANLINFVRGDQITGLRDRQLTVGGSLKVWKLGDSIHSAPTVVGAPALRYDLIYGDTTYGDFLAAYKDRRNVVYAGANDGMLHAFNAGYYKRGDDPATTTVVEHGRFCTTPSCGVGTALGEELWAFIPQELLPHLRWLADPDYTHVYYVDLKPKVVDVRIFCDAGGGAPVGCINGQPSAVSGHPKGWGTILIGGFRLGGSCGACTSADGAPPMTYTADFDGDGTTETRTFYSAYFVLDITDPDQDPKLLWSFTDANLGLATAVPSVLRVLDKNAPMRDSSANWYLVFGSGPTGYGGTAAQGGKLFAMDLMVGPAGVQTFSEGSSTSFMSDTLTVDQDLDYRVDVTYVGSTIDNSASSPPDWVGKLHRLTTNDCATSPCPASAWGVDVSGTRMPTVIVQTLGTLTGPPELGPVGASPAATVDDTGKLWVFAGTGKLWNSTDRANTDTQYFLGVKDSVFVAGCAQGTTQTNCLDEDLVDVSAAAVCVVGTGDCGSGTNEVTGVTGVTDIKGLIQEVNGRDGWVTSLSAGTGERVLVRPIVFAGFVVFPSFTPTSSVCDAVAIGSSTLYALHYLTGGPTGSPVLGTEAGAGGNEMVKRSTSLGEGVASQAVVHVGKGSSAGKASLVVQSSTGELINLTADTGGAITSRFISWYDARQ